ncbi:MAG TPA: hypothetical protein ENK04_01705 [Gammaproteobacteria bacterium]|nr:hypothetical protein [Gammaproteobacteria bacterium]
MLTRCSTLLICTALLIACSEPELNIPDRNSIGASQPLIEIYSPVGDAVLPAHTPFIVDYAILRSPDGHHVKIRVDNDAPQIVLRLKGKHQIRGLPVGTHRIRITEYTKYDVKTGGDITLSVTMRAAAGPFENGAALK